MKVVILAGGYGTRLSEYTSSIPKPMVPIAGRPIIWHIMSHYASYGYRDFIVALGYKSEIIKDYFLNYKTLNSDFTVDLSTGQISSLHTTPVDWRVSLIDTGQDTLTGGRLRRLQPYLDNQAFMLTYGDGLANVDLGNLVNYHHSHDCIATMTAVRPPARFGELQLDLGKVVTFQEKPQLVDGWINGGFFVLNSSIFNYLNDDNQMFEREPLTSLSSDNQLMAYRHEGFWQCMDTKRDLDLLQRLAQTSPVPWSK